MKADAVQCFDDWCIGVAQFRHTLREGKDLWTIDLRLQSRARRVSQREKNLTVYFTDNQENRYDALPDPSDSPFSLLLHPGESAIVTRSFLVPTDASHIGLVITHQGGFPIGWFIIGYYTWFRKPALIEVE